MSTLIVIFSSILISATTINHDAQPGRSKAFFDKDRLNTEPHQQITVSDGPTILIDSSGNGYSAWTQTQECLSYNPTIGGLQFVCRGYSPTGILNVHQTNSTGSFWVHDYAVYDQEYGPARYPTSCATDGPHISMPVLDPAAWGYMVAEYEEGGWWSQFWALPEDVGPGGHGIHKVIGKQLSNGNILVVGYTDTDEIYYRTMSPDLQTTIASGTVATGYYYWGFDCNGGVAYMFYYDASLNIYYRSTTDGITWTAQQSYNMIWPEPYANNLIFWTQMAVTDAGNPILVFDNLDNNDYQTGTYPYLSKVYISTASGGACVEASAPYTRSWYSTVATSGNVVVVMYHVARASSGVDSLAFQDVVAAVSTNGGVSFGSHINLTSSLTNRPGLAQLAKRLDLTNGNFFYFYGINTVVNHDPIWHCWRDPEGLDPHAWYIYDPSDGIHEDQTLETGKSNAMLTVYPNPFIQKTNIRYMMQDSRCMIMNIFDAAGRSVKSFDLGSYIMNHGSVITWHGLDDHGQELPPGVYFVKLQGENLTDIDKVVKVE
ncbi:hypothetical protein A2Y85_03005 [candidate division WOR-3 bacterium RBG_13_43_14]|uniref:Secretion system C-terminal sorting domain-containing protein n=1 Tax=candidate division WOR-3 bacterium RBG_13_43_14 TaxID=1802590 RepID=A0A1F4UDG2_UNCW3|nr:MAG: hypothetical protein A2Y85_03005 [candidate division WOR-3 bacterium RBG_13_43_14]